MPPEFLLALRNDLVRRVSELPPLKGYKVYQDWYFQRALDLLDPSLPGNIRKSTPEHACLLFRDALNRIK